MVLGQEHVPQALLAGLGLKGFHDGWVGGPSLIAFAQLGLEDLFGGNTFFFDKLFDLCGGCEISIEPGERMGGDGIPGPGSSWPVR